MHTKQLQRSEYVKLDDNILNYHFGAGGKETDGQVKKPYTEEELKVKREDVNAAQIKYLSTRQVQEKRQCEMN